MGQNTVRTLRVLEIMKETDEEHPLTSSGILDKLENLYGITAERKAVGRDIEDLNYCGYSIVPHGDSKRGWYLEHPFEDWELKILMDAVQSAKFLDRADTDRLSEKLRSLASADSRRTLALMTVPADAKRGGPLHPLHRGQCPAGHADPQKGAVPVCLHRRPEAHRAQAPGGHEAREPLRPHLAQGQILSHRHL